MAFHKNITKLKGKMMKKITLLTKRKKKLSLLAQNIRGLNPY